MLVTFQAMIGTPVTYIQAKRSKGPSITMQGLNSWCYIQFKSSHHIIVRIKKRSRLV
jgi:hypothetical protein